MRSTVAAGQGSGHRVRLRKISRRGRTGSEIVFRNAGLHGQRGRSQDRAARLHQF